MSFYRFDANASRDVSGKNLRTINLKLKECEENAGKDDFATALQVCAQLQPLCTKENLSKYTKDDLNALFSTFDAFLGKLAKKRAEGATTLEQELEKILETTSEILGPCEEEEKVKTTRSP